MIGALTKLTKLQVFFAINFKIVSIDDELLTDKLDEFINML